MKQDYTFLLCTELQTVPRPEVGKILVTGATGYIGGRLVPELLARGYNVRVMARVDKQESEERWPDAETIVADALNPEQLLIALKGIHTAYYLIHSSGPGQKKMGKSDIKAARNFRKAAEICEVKRVIYLGALVEKHKSILLKSIKPASVAGELHKGTVPTTHLHVSMIIGSGSAPYELMKSLIQKTPIILFPKWALNKCQPIGLRSLMHILVGVLEKEETTGKTFDIGGPEVLTYEMMFKIMAKVFNKRKFYRRTFYSGVRIYAYVASIITPLPAAVIRSLIESFGDDVVCRNDDDILNTIYKPLKFKEAILKAMSREEQDAVHTRWSDEYPPAHELAIKLHELKTPAHYISTYSISSEKSRNLLFNSFCTIGGEAGWLHNNWMWRLRGLLDQLFLGVGITRGRRSNTSLRMNDVIDFWRVEEIEEDTKLLLRAEMRLPGMAWLEFVLDNEEDKSKLSVTAYYEARGFQGKLYWYFFLPFHHVIFTNLLKQIVMRA